MDISLWLAHLAASTVLLLIAGSTMHVVPAHPVGHGRRATASLRRAVA